MYQAPNAPLSIGGVLDAGFRLFRECFAQVFLFALAIALVSAPASSLGPTLVQSGATVSAMLPQLLGIGLAISIVALVLTCAMIARIDGVARNAPISIGEAFARGVARALATFASYLLLMLAVCIVPIALSVGAALGGLSNPAAIGALFVLLFLFPGSVIAIWLFFGPIATIVDSKGPVEGLKYSRAITRGHWWRTTALLTIIMIILMVVYMVLGIASAVQAVSDPIGAATGQQPWYLQYVITPVVSACAAPLMYGLFLAAYYDLKVRHEGGDLAARIAGTA
jgi:hypothetical protein